jgi:hypothetical protein
LLLVSAIVAVVVFVDASNDEAEAGEVLLEPATGAGPFPWTSSIVPPGAPASVPLPTVATTVVDTSAAARLTAVRGDRVGIYGGSLDLTVCDKEQLIGFLEQNAGQASAFAGVLRITPADIRPYVTSLTPVILGADTRVTNHGYDPDKAEATPRQSVLH